MPKVNLMRLFIPAADHELVEVDGFVFRRKRRAITPSPALPPAQAEATARSLARSPAAIKLGLQLDAVSPAAADRTADDEALGDQADATAPEGQHPAEIGAADEQAADAEDSAEEIDMIPATQVRMPWRSTNTV